MHYSWEYAQQVHFPPTMHNRLDLCTLEHPGNATSLECAQKEQDFIIQSSNSMMIAGHTKFEPDWHFGIWKLKWRNASIETMEQVAESVNSSSRNGHNVAQLVSDVEKPVIFQDWKKLLQQYFKPLKYISKYHHFTVSKDTQGCVTCKESNSSPAIAVNLLKRKECLPTASVVPDAARQWYLYEQIREFCLSESSKDIICPKPTVPKPRTALAELNSATAKPVTSKRKHVYYLTCFMLVIAVLLTFSLLVCNGIFIHQKGTVIVGILHHL